MKIAILSDIHDNIWNLEKVLSSIKGNTEAIIYCGDFCAPFVPPKLDDLNIPVFACLGNNDEDQIAMVKRTPKNFHWTPLGDEFGQTELSNKKIAFCHYPKLAELLAKSGEFDAVFHGHTHFSRNETIGKSLLVNPGAICGIQNGKEGEASYAIYDTEKNTAEIREIV